MIDVEAFESCLTDPQKKCPGDQTSWEHLSGAVQGDEAAKEELVRLLWLVGVLEYENKQLKDPSARRAQEVREALASLRRL